ncbi:saccharopine dehydrogenase NADP-binding domain-containing protein [Nocardioides sp. CER19]|uniref:saccharopine dehydrogenase family protein n=1 Tax=Nocardioides sp. CER19 TaxID=3038538 RepID=UPI00244ADFF6|nr:saccharopine dehydrogenase NADP-binding domain-containing protein [Nocardioides sp. CER19]MDH2416115.1 saccharopine dehydrogenase NADP-binding domain-containing protein [Nocardioides sp. CER19]
MRIIALGGAGGMGHAALKVMASEYTFSEVIVADLNADAAQLVATELRALGQPASSQRIDVSDREALLELLAGADLVMNSVGPYFRFGVPILEAAIESKVRYIDLCDDAQPTVDMLALDERAKAAGITAVIGAGASPGLMNVFAKLAAQGLDSLEDITVGWTLNNAQRNWDMMRAGEDDESDEKGGDAALVHFFEQFMHTVPAYVDGQLSERATRHQVRIDVPGLGSGTGYSVGHPEPVTLPATLKAHGSSLSVCLMSSDRAIALTGIAADLEAGMIDYAQAGERTIDAVMAPTAVDDDPAFPGAGDLPTYFVLLSGERDGKQVHQFAGCVSKPAPMRIGTGVPYGIATGTIAEADLAPGVYPLDAVMEPEPYLTKVAEHWGVPRDQLYFTGSAPIGELAKS